jgi:hypothetical protein
MCLNGYLQELVRIVSLQDGNGQFELNWEYDDCLATADKHTFFKFMVKSVAEKHGTRLPCLSLIVDLHKLHTSFLE